VTTSYQYDAFGNPTQIAVSATEGHTKTTTNTYTNDTANWLLGRLTNATVTSQTSQPGAPPPLPSTPAIVSILDSMWNFNLWNYMKNVGAAGASSSVNVTIAPGVVVGSTSSSVPAFDTGAFPAGNTVQITNNGIIVGAGGAGGAGGYCGSIAATPAAPAGRRSVPRSL
jgi:hypothetical protein